MAIMTKPNGKFLVEVDLPTGRVRRTASTRAEAEQIEATLKFFPVPVSTPVASDYTVGQLAKDAKVIWRGTKDETQSLKRFEVACSLLGHDKPLMSIRTAALDTLVTTLRNRGLADGTIHRYLSTISAALRWACARDYIAGLPIIPWTNSGGQRDTVIAPEDDERLVNWLRDMGYVNVALVYDVLLATGARINEVLGLDLSDVSPETEEVRFRDTKNGTDRIVPLQRELAVALEALIETSTMPTYSHVYRASLKARKALGIEHSVTPHIMRHTVATRLAAENDVSIKTIGTLLGHKSERTTNKYLHPEKQTIKRAANKLMRK